MDWTEFFYCAGAALTVGSGSTLSNAVRGGQTADEKSRKRRGAMLSVSGFRGGYLLKDNRADEHALLCAAATTTLR